MAILPNPETHEDGNATATPSPGPSRLEIETWTEQATEALQNVILSSPAPAFHGSSVALTIPLDEPTSNRVRLEAPPRPQAYPDTPLRRHSHIRRDSLKRREALLKGKEGSRRRQRWENDRLLNNPHAQPPLPSDWEVHPTYPRHAVPYYLAPLWDEKLARDHKTKNDTKGETTQREDSLGKIPKELREKFKRARGAKSLLEALEREVRAFVEEWEQKKKHSAHDDFGDLDSEDEEIVFVGRNGQMNDMASSRASLDEVPAHPERLVFESLADDHGASFGRWLVHSIASYYGLRTWSVTVGDPARREAYVGIKMDRVRTETIRPGSLPRPLWGLV
ncbi:hypothetical protein L228DRAFT_265963 [Xylona heveae TC161]|uniref:R3H-associated N-terminal domain-containing protein n=1 Tax=Xylona heveae (strain CBS 132557 / TC161) TaxID=1328760 RepID=A0A165IX27_XYLHT|nr:hypothetical protein L228DRAFT_265963 [Xylona heveae TC161]KZF25494.1 hypothetical protein L228DRAFT_265963 [Xylona heveae TC161]